MKLHRSQRLIVTSFFLFSTLLSGCFGSSKGGSIMDGRVNDEAAPPFVEAFIEYPGPSEKWAGPHSLSAHLSARGGKSGEIAVIHPMFKMVDAHPAISVEKAREQFDRIQAIINHELKSTANCSSPVKIRLIRTDGAVISKQACRGQSGWPRVASDLTAQWLGLALSSAELGMQKAKSTELATEKTPSMSRK